MPDDPPSSLKGRSGLIDRLPSWSFLALLAGIVALFWLLSLINREIFWDNFIDKYFWTPIVEDEGYNVANTIGLMVVLACILGWGYRLMAELGETVDLEFTLAVVPYMVWGSVYRVLEDSDLFGPFNQDILQSGGRIDQLGSSCFPGAGGSFLHHCFGVFFITPIIYVIVTFIAVFFLWLGHRARRVSERLGAAKGIQFFGLTLVGLLALYMALWAADQTFIRFVANPVVALAGCAVAFWIVWRDTGRRGWVNPRWAMFAYAMVFLIVGLYYVFIWMTGGEGTWRTGEEVSWWVLVAVIVGPVLVAFSTRRKGRELSGGFPDIDSDRRRVKEPGKHVALLMVLVIVDGLLVFASMLAVHNIEEGLDAGTLFSDFRNLAIQIVLLLVGPAAVLGTTKLAGRLAHGSFGVHPALVFFAAPVNLIMVFGQASDGMMTSLGIDVFHYTEKHVLPRFLIDLVDGLGLPAPFGNYPTTMVMIPLKILIVLAVVWLIDISTAEEPGSRRNLVGLVKLAIIMVGLSPGIRDAVRLAMAT